MSTEIITLIFSFVITISTVFYVILTRSLVKETKELRKAQIQPFISVFISNSETETGILYLNIENIGNGPALNVKFEIIRDISKQEFCTPLKEMLPFQKGIGYFPPKNKIESYLVSELNEEEYNNFIEFKLTYKNILNETIQDKFKLVFNEAILSGLSEPPRTYIGQTAYFLKKIYKLYEKSLGACRTL